ncbi:MAG TPA: hypothetical protein VGY99_20975 [Candidatus Binataceae bacterium]|jgi:hypothetical protein|nr:hypothetical protein [Candidatus Binataceae bacterium]
MLIYPDSSDLIDLCRGGAGVKISGLAQKLFAKSHRIALSFDTLIEVAAPLRDGRALEVRRDLNQLEELPHVFVNEGRILDTEIREALSAFEQQREYNVAAVAPFASRLDTAIDLHGAPQYVVEHMGSRPIRVQTEMIVNFRIWEIIQYVWNRDPEAFNVQRRREPEWISLLESDRAMARPPTLRDHFVTVMSQNLKRHGIRPPAAGAEPFARWVYESPLRCPGVRLVYETYHRFRRNRAARPRASDLVDLTRLASVPYVDFFVTDAAMMDYCKQAAAEIGRPYQQLLGNFRTVMSHLSIG